MIEVAHESLIRYWPRLRRWLDEDRADVRVRDSVRIAAQDWVRNRGNESLLLHHGEQLSEAEGLRANDRIGLNQEEEEYLCACKQREELQKRKESRYRRRIVVTSLLGTLVASCLAIWAGFERTNAIKLASEKNTLFEKEREARLETDAYLYVTKMAAVQKAWNSRDVPQAQKILASLVPGSTDERDLRSFEWYYFWRLCNSRLLTLNTRDTKSGLSNDVVFMVRFISDDRLFVITGEEVQLWDLGTGKVISLSRGGPPGDAAFSADGKRCPVIMGDVIEFFLVSKVNARISLPYKPTFNKISFLPDTAPLAAVVESNDEEDRNRSLILWDTIKNEQINKIPLDERFRPIAWSSDGRYLVTLELGKGFFEVFDAKDARRAEVSYSGQVSERYLKDPTKIGGDISRSGKWLALRIKAPKANENVGWQISLYPRHFENRVVNNPIDWSPSGGAPWSTAFSTDESLLVNDHHIYSDLVRSHLELWGCCSGSEG